MSEEDIAKGDRAIPSISRMLDEAEFGIVCLTPQNVAAPWLHFEAGALSKKLEQSRLSPLLLGLRKADVVGPLAQFQATSIDRDDFERLMHSINGACARPLLPEQVKRALTKWWPDLDERLKVIDSAQGTQPQAEHRDDRELLEEVLERVRAIQRMRRPEPRRHDTSSAVTSEAQDENTRTCQYCHQIVVTFAIDTPRWRCPSCGEINDVTIQEVDEIIRGLSARIRSRFRVGHFVSIENGVAILVVPNAFHLDRCDQVRSEVEQALSAHFGRDISIQLVVDGQNSVAHEE